jgi:hypothetical protein
MNSRQAHGAESEPMLREQLKRIESLSSFPLEAGEVALSRPTQERARAIVEMLWEYSDSKVRKILESMFITFIGSGDIQIEWEIGDRYLEFEIPAQGPFYFLSEAGDHQREGSVQDESELVQMVQNF